MGESIDDENVVHDTGRLTSVYATTQMNNTLTQRKKSEKEFIKENEKTIICKVGLFCQELTLPNSSSVLCKVTDAEIVRLSEIVNVENQ